jgi:Flp pilus assembly pilin Flp
MTEPASLPSARSPARQRGSATAEYVIVAALVIIVLIANENVIKQLADAIRNAYASFAYALSVSWL